MENKKDGLYTDKLARTITEPGSPCLAALAEAFTPAILNEDGSLNRPELAKRAFATAETAQLLNSITHPAIVALTRQEIEHAAEQGYAVAVVDAPLLYEAKADALCDSIVAVTAPSNVRKQRIMARDSLTEQQASQRMAAQHPDAFYCREGVMVLDGSGDAATLQASAKQLLNSLLSN